MRFHFPLAIARCLLVVAAAFPLAASSANLDLAADAVLGKPGFTSPAGGFISASQLGGVKAVAEDSVTGELWVVDGVHRVLRFASAAAFTNGQAANLVLGQPDFASIGINRGGPVANNSMSSPAGLAVNQAGDLYVSDTGNNRVLVFRAPYTNGMAAAVVIGQPNFTSAAVNAGGAISAFALSAPNGLAIDSVGNLFVADSGNGRVLRFGQPHRIGSPVQAGRVYGKPGFTTNTSPVNANGLVQPAAVAIGANGDLWVADSAARVLRYAGGTSEDEDSTADVVLCQPDFASTGLGSTLAGCSVLTGIAVDLEGVVYVSDYFNNRVLHFDANATTGASATAVVGQVGLGADCNRGLGTPSDVTLCAPWGLAIDGAGNLLVADGGNERVLRYDVPRNRLVPVAADLSPASAARGLAFELTVNGSNFHEGSVIQWDGQPRPTQFISPNRLLAQIPASDVAAEKTVQVTVSTPAPGGGTSTGLQVVVYARNALDNQADRFLFFPNFEDPYPAINFQDFDEWHVGGAQLGRVGAGTAERFSTRTIAVDPVSGRLFISDLALSRVLSWPSAQALANAQPADIVIGQPDEFRTDCDVDGGVPTRMPTARSLCFPESVAVDSQGALYVSDGMNNRVLKFVPPFSTGMAATMVFGQGGSFTTALENNGGQSATSLSRPIGIAAKGTTLAVHDAGNRRVLVFNGTADAIADVVIGQPNFTDSPNSGLGSTSLGVGTGYVALDDAGRLFYSGNNRVMGFAPPLANGMAATFTIGTGNAGLASNLLSSNAGVAVDLAGSLLVADLANHRVLRFSPPFVTSMAATGVLGQVGFTTNVIGSTRTLLTRPMGLAVDAVGNVYLSEQSTPRLLAFDRPFSFAIDPAGDIDHDGIPNGLESGEGRDAFVKDNDIFAAGHPGPRLFAMQQYRDFLGREGDEQGVAYYTYFLTIGDLTRAQAIENFFNSGEFSGVASPIARLYFATFLRTPDYAGLTFQIAIFKSGASLAAIANNFTLSPEFTTRYGALTNAQYVTLLYQNILGRTPVQAEIDFHVNRLTTGTSRGEVLVGFSESPEYKAVIGNEVYVTMMYVGMLRRAPDPGGLTFWVNYMDAGNSGLALILGFLNAPEYRNRFLP